MSIASVLSGERPVWVECGDSLTVLRTMPDNCVNLSLCSPPYYSLRDYGTGQWEGGDPSCDHVQGLARQDGNRRAKRGVFENGEQVERHEGGKLQYRTICGKCGARRVDQQIGMEDRHDCQGWAGAFDPRSLHDAILQIVSGPHHPEAQAQILVDLIASAQAKPCGVCYICHLLAVFTEVKRVLRQDGVLVCNISDTYNSGGGTSGGGKHAYKGGARGSNTNNGVANLEEGSMLGIPWRLALAMQSQGWLLRSSVIWSKLAPMPESVQGWRYERCRVSVRQVPRKTGRGGRHDCFHVPYGLATGKKPEDIPEFAPCPGCKKCELHGGYVLRKGSWRPTRSHEHVFIFAKSSSYWCDGDAVRTPAVKEWNPLTNGPVGRNGLLPGQGGQSHKGMAVPNPLGANLRDVLWTDEGPLFRLRDDLTDEQRKQVAEFLEPYQSDEQGDVLLLGPEPCSIACIVQPSPDCPLHAGQPGPIYVDRPPPSWKKCTCERTSHFAAFPTTLCRPFLEAFCPQRCCAECGTGWVRVVERIPPTKTGVATGKAGEVYGKTKGCSSSTLTLQWRDWYEHGPQQETLGWRPACNCNSKAEPVAGVALDCFSGTGTLALTARRMGLRAIGVELSESYAILSRERIRRDSTLFNEVVEPAAPVVPPGPEPDLFGQLED